MCSTTRAWGASSARSRAPTGRCSTTRTPARPSSATCAAAPRPAPRNAGPGRPRRRRGRRRTGSGSSGGGGPPGCSRGRGDGRASHRTSRGRRASRSRQARRVCDRAPAVREEPVTMATRHLIIGGGTAGMNAIRTIREEEGERSEIALVSAETPYSRMVLPYYLDRSIDESHVFTATPRVLADWGVKPHVGRRATALDTKANVCTLDDGTRLEYDDCLIATGSSAVKAPVPGADGRGVHSFWTLGEARAVLAEIAPGSHVVMVGAGFIAFTILNSILAPGAKLTIVEVAPRILPRMVDDAAAKLVQAWLEKNGVTVRTNSAVTGVEDAKGKKRLRFKSGGDVVGDVVIMATGIRTNLEWLKDSGGGIKH